jgi:hypothetical protein
LWLFFVVLPYLSQYSITICNQSAIFYFSWRSYLYIEMESVCTCADCRLWKLQYVFHEISTKWKLCKLLCVILKFHLFHIVKYCVVISFCKMSRLCFHFLWCSPLYIQSQNSYIQSSTISPFSNWRSHPSYLILLVQFN